MENINKKTNKPLKIKDGDRITPEMVKKFTGYVNSFSPMNSTFSYDLRRLVIESGIGISFTETPSSSYAFIIVPERLEDLYKIMARTCSSWNKEWIEKNLHKRNTEDFIGCRIYL